MRGVKLSQNAVEERVNKCFELRFNNQGTNFGHKEWIAYCKENYGDKSENTYTDYWMESSRRHKKFWKDKMDNQLSFAVDKMIEMLEHEDPRVVQKAIEQLFKYSGNDVEKIDMNIEGDIKLNWGQ